jgi:MerR family mercuric resistance operon transcriptional regulator
MTIAQLARALGTSIKDVQLYVQSGVLQPPRRRRGRSGDFAFHKEHLERLCFIKRARRVGFNLQDIGLLVGPTGLVTCGDVKDLASERLRNLRAATSTRQHETFELEALIESCSGLGSRRECKLLEKLSRFTTPAD